MCYKEYQSTLYGFLTGATEKEFNSFGEAHSGELVHYESLMVLKFYISHLSGRFVITFPHVGVIPINPVPKILPLHQ